MSAHIEKRWSREHGINYRVSNGSTKWLLFTTEELAALHDQITTALGGAHHEQHR